MKRRVGQKVDPLSNEIFIKETYDPNASTGKTTNNKNEEDDEDEDDDEDEEDEDEEGEGEDGGNDGDEFEDDLVKWWSYLLYMHTVYCTCNTCIYMYVHIHNALYTTVYVHI